MEFQQSPPGAEAQVVAATAAKGGLATTYLGDPQPITETVTGFRPRGIEQFLREELFPG